MKLRHIFWGLLLADISWQVLHFGGMTLLDQMIHALFLAMATLVMIWIGRFRKLSAHAWIPIVVLILGAVVQVLPLPEFLVRLLVPGKAELAGQVNAFFPDAVKLTQVAFLPGFLKVRLSSWILDGWFFALVLGGAHFSKKILYYWVGGLSLLLGSVLLMDASGKWEGQISHFISGPGNENQIAGFLVLLMAVGIGLVLSELIRWRRSRHQKPYQRFPILAAASVGIGINVLALFQQGSRSGFLLAVILVCSVPAWWMIESSRRWLAFSGAVIACVVGLIAMLSIDSQKLTEKVQVKGFYDQARHEVYKIGTDELWPPALLGHGLGATPALLVYRFPSGPYNNVEMTEFHNDLIQLLIEMGLPGLVLIGFIGYWLFLIWSKANLVRSITDRYFLFSVGMVTLLAGLQSLVSFPLRIVGIRLFILLLLGLALRMVHDDQLRSKNRWPPVFVLVFALGIFWLLNSHRMVYLNDPNPQVARAARYGTVFNIPLFQANEALKTLLDPLPITGPSSLWQDARTLSVHALKSQPTSLRAMNLIFQLDLMKAGPQMQRHEFDRFKEQAEFIKNLGHPDNQNAPLAKLLLFQSHPNLLNAEEMEELEALQRKYKYRLRRAIRQRKG